jgi:hypothetical protein
VQDFGVHCIDDESQLKFAVQSPSALQAAAAQRKVVPHAMLGPQSAFVLQPLLHCGNGCAPPWKHSHGKSQMKPAPASWQSASVWHMPLPLLLHMPPQSGGRMVTPQYQPTAQSD